jgi:23S rRNA pseudouridine2605 synthase
MADEHKHPADAPEQEITSDAAELLEREARVDDAEEGATAGFEPPTVSLIEPREAIETEPAGPMPSTETLRPAQKLERLQKILAQAGVASRRHAEDLITQGRVQVNGHTVTVLGSKADPMRDHIRVDGKLLHGAERLRYFVLNKPKGYVTTVSDPEGRPTVMRFFAKESERLYPVGRLDYQSEGLIVVTNDGELAHRLTQAASGVEKTYLVKVAGQPSESALDRLRRGVAIERDKHGSGKVHAAPVRIRPVRSGDNPWYEVVLVEGRNRELRKMFEEIGHHVEKIRRLGYGPLVLDIEPGKVRELSAEEVRALRLTAEGKLKPRRLQSARLLATEASQSAVDRPTGAERAGKRPPPRIEKKRQRPARSFKEPRTGARGKEKAREFGQVRGGRFGVNRPNPTGKRPPPRIETKHERPGRSFKEPRTGARGKENAREFGQIRGGLAGVDGPNRTGKRPPPRIETKHERPGRSFKEPGTGARGEENAREFGQVRGGRFGVNRPNPTGKRPPPRIETKHERPGRSFKEPRTDARGKENAREFGQVRRGRFGAERPNRTGAREGGRRSFPRHGDQETPSRRDRREQARTIFPVEERSSGARSRSGGAFRGFAPGRKAGRREAQFSGPRGAAKRSDQRGKGRKLR